MKDYLIQEKTFDLDRDEKFIVDHFKRSFLLSENMDRARALATLACPEWEDHIGDVELRQIINETIAPAKKTVLTSLYACLHPKCRMLLQDHNSILPHVKRFHPDQLRINTVGRKRKAAWISRAVDNMEECPTGKKFLAAFKDKNTRFYENVSVSQHTVLFTAPRIEPARQHLDQPHLIHLYPTEFPEEE